jgi:hypothetical protein
MSVNTLEARIVRFNSYHAKRKYKRVVCTAINAVFHGFENWGEKS